MLIRSFLVKSLQFLQSASILTGGWWENCRAGLVGGGLLTLCPFWLPCVPFDIRSLWHIDHHHGHFAKSISVQSMEALTLSYDKRRRDSDTLGKNPFSTRSRLPHRARKANTKSRAGPYGPTNTMNLLAQDTLLKLPDLLALVYGMVPHERDECLSIMESEREKKHSKSLATTEIRSTTVDRARHVSFLVSGSQET